MIKYIFKVLFIAVILFSSRPMLAQEQSDPSQAIASSTRASKPLSSSQTPQQTQPWDIVWAHRISKLSYGAAFVAHVWNLGQWYKSAPASSKDKVWKLTNADASDIANMSSCALVNKSAIPSNLPNQSTHFDPITFGPLGDQPCTLFTLPPQNTAMMNASYPNVMSSSPLAYIQQNDQTWSLHLERTRFTKQSILWQGIVMLLGVGVSYKYMAEHGNDSVTFIISSAFSIATYSTPFVMVLRLIGAAAHVYGMYRERQLQQRG